MQHEAPDAESGAPLHDLTGNGVYPRDVYETLWQYRTGDPLDRDAEAFVTAYRGKPDRKKWICRAVPKGVRVINPGDWVTIVRGYARQHGKHPSDPSQDMPVVCARAPAREIHTNGDSLLEWGYNGPAPLRATVVWRPRGPRKPRKPTSSWERIQRRRG